MLRFLLDKVAFKLKDGMNPKKAVDSVADEQGISKDGRTYEYLLQRAYEMKGE